jgi:N-acetylglucosamine-6-phosphate deacetylase
MKRKAVKATLLVAGDVYTPEKRIRGGALVAQGGKILFAGPRAGAGRVIRVLHDRSRSFDLEILEYPDFSAVPGFIDTHLHGGSGADIMDGTPEAVATALRHHLRNGTTSVLATVMTAAHAEILRAIAAVRQAARTAVPIPDVLGIHLEGPYLAKEKRGAQPEAHIRPFAASEMREYLAAAEGTIRVVTLAPELAGAKSFIGRLKKRGIIAAAGHSRATFEEARAAIRAGIRHGTHLFNAMSGVFHRDPGLAGALLLDDAVSVEVIADGVHLHPAVVELVLGLKPREKVILITDATRRAGESREPLQTPDGRLYGSSITLGEAVRNVAAWTGRPLAEILPFATSNPARLLGVLARKGRIGRGADADILLLDRRLRVRKVFLRGNEVY